MFKGHIHIGVMLAICGAPFLALSQTVISVDAAAKRHSINPLIYGTAWSTPQQLLDLNFTFHRAGGDSMSTYNWLANGDNRGADYYYETYPDTSWIAGERDDTFMETSKLGRTQAAITVPMLPYIGKLGPNRTSTRSFSQRKYGPQTGWDPYNFDAGNGVSARAGNPFVKNDPLDAATPNTAADQMKWVDHMIDRWDVPAWAASNTI